jgi:hypothetical protein
MRIYLNRLIETKFKVILSKLNTGVNNVFIYLLTSNHKVTTRNVAQRVVY